jgi:hypothetical protein
VTTRLKTTTSIIEKLRRQGGGSLPNIQDLAGIRIIEDIDLDEQDEMSKRVIALFVDGHKPPKLMDRRFNLSRGYRAVHVVYSGMTPVEVQIRTVMQHRWANMYEKLADVVGRGIRYGEPADDWSRGLGGPLFSVLERGKAVGSLAWLQNLVSVVPPAIDSIITSAIETSDATITREIAQTVVNRGYIEIGVPLDNAELVDVREKLRETVEIYETRFAQHGEVIEAFLKARTTISSAFQQIRDQLDPVLLSCLEIIGTVNTNDPLAIRERLGEVLSKDTSSLELLLSANSDAGYRNIAESGNVAEFESWASGITSDGEGVARIMRRITRFEGQTSARLER